MKDKYLALTKYILILILSILLIRFAIIKMNSSNTQTLSNSIKNSFALEPDTPTNIDDPPSYSPPLPQNEVAVEQVIEKGEEIPIKFIYNDPKWKRPAYKEYWHSKYGRWSYVPTRLHYAMHRIFSTYATASRYYDFVHDLGIAYESDDFNDYEYTPPPSPFEYLEIVVMNTLIEKVITYDNQIVIIGKPQRTGLQAIIIPTEKINPIENADNILIQLVTPDGYEIDYTTEMLLYPN
jgi:hypothetical protein